MQNYPDTMNKQLVLSDQGCLDDLEFIAKKITNELLHTENFCLWLVGEMGAGKTTFTGYMLRSLGLPPIIPVTSPTFAYLNEYEIADKLYAHMDLYRIESDDFSLEELGLDEDRNFRGLFVEWPSKIKQHDELKATHILEISSLENGLVREYKLWKMLTES